MLSVAQGQRSVCECLFVPALIWVEELYFCISVELFKFTNHVRSLFNFGISFFYENILTFLVSNFVSTDWVCRRVEASWNEKQILTNITAWKTKEYSVSTCILYCSISKPFLLLLIFSLCSFCTIWTRIQMEYLLAVLELRDSLGHCLL